MPVDTVLAARGHSRHRGTRRRSRPPSGRRVRSPSTNRPGRAVVGDRCRRCRCPSRRSGCPRSRARRRRRRWRRRPRPGRSSGPVQVRGQHEGDLGLDLRLQQRGRCRSARPARRPCRRTARRSRAGRRRAAPAPPGWSARSCGRRRGRRPRPGRRPRRPAPRRRRRRPRPAAASRTGGQGRRSARAATSLSERLQRAARRASRERSSLTSAHLEGRADAHAGDPLRHRLVARPHQRRARRRRSPISQVRISWPPLPACSSSPSSPRLGDRVEVGRDQLLEEPGVPGGVDLGVRVAAHGADPRLAGGREGPHVARGRGSSRARRSAGTDGSRGSLDGSQCDRPPLATTSTRPASAAADRGAERPAERHAAGHRRQRRRGGVDDQRDQREVGAGRGPCRSSARCRGRRSARRTARRRTRRAASPSRIDQASSDATGSGPRRLPKSPKPSASSTPSTNGGITS